MVARLIELLTARLREAAQNAQVLAAQRAGNSPRTVAPVLLGPGEGHVDEPHGSSRSLVPEPAPVPDPMPAEQPSTRFGRLRQRLRDPESVREAFVLKELLDPPLAQRRRQR